MILPLLLIVSVALRFHQICVMFLYTSNMVNCCTFHVYFLDTCHSQNTGKQLQDGEDAKPLGVKSLITPYELCMQNEPNYAFLRVFLWFYVYLTIYSLSVSYLLPNFKSFLDDFSLFIYIFSFILSI